MRICVTGAAGMTGRATVDELLEHDFEVLATDLAPAPEHFAGADLDWVRADLTDFGDTVELLDGVDAVVHLANIPAPGLFTPARTLSTNTVMNGNVFLAAQQIGLDRVVWASSETTLGLDFGVDRAPRYAPLDDDHFPFPTTTYSLSKVVGETQAEHIAAWSGIPFVGLRFSNVIPLERYASFPLDWADPQRRIFNLWSYVDVRDAALSCRLALHADVTGASSHLIAAADSTMTTPSADLMAEFFPDVPITRELGTFESLQSTEHARRELGYVPAHTWRDHVETPVG